MNKSEPFIDRTLMPERSGRDIDTLLREFFRRQVPDPWPGPPQVQNKPGARSTLLRPSRPWQRGRRYLALAAVVALFVLGYWGLSTAFPDVLPSSIPLKGPLIGDKPDPNIIVPEPDQPGLDGKQQGLHNTPEQIKTPSGEARVYEQKDGNNTFIRIEALPKALKPLGK
jgi:hypothetical protein